MRGFEQGGAGVVVDVGAGRDPDAADLRGQHVGDVVAVEVERRDDRIVFGLQQRVLQEGVGDAVLDHEAAGGDLRAEFFLRQFIAPALEAAFGVFHDVALVHEGDGRAAVVERIATGGADEPARAFTRDGLDPVGGTLRETDLAHPHLFAQEAAELFRLRRAGLPFDAGVDVLRVLAEDHHVHPLGMPHGRGDPAEPAHRAQAHVQVEPLAQGHVQRTDAAPDRRRQGTLDADPVGPESLHRLVREVGSERVESLLSGGHFQPVQAPVAVRLGYGGIQDAAHRRGDLGSHAVAGDIGYRHGNHFERVLSAEPARNQASCCGV